MSKLNELQRRTIARAAVGAEGYGAITEIAHTYKITRSRVNQIKAEYTDPEKLARLEDEVEFRRALIRQRRRHKEAS